MAIRTTNNQVLALLPASDLSAVPFIEMASSIVDDSLVGQGFTAAKLELIERWLAAHLFASTVEPQIKSTKTLDAADIYVIKGGLGLNATTYGQMVQVLDTTGLLKALGGKIAKIESITSFTD